jgi:hypothetical protein
MNNGEKTKFILFLTFDIEAEADSVILKRILPCLAEITFYSGPKVPVSRRARSKDPTPFLILLFLILRFSYLCPQHILGAFHMLPTLHTGGLSYLNKANDRNLLIDRSLSFRFSYHNNKSLQEF